jgi:hypothetical protein
MLIVVHIQKLMSQLKYVCLDIVGKMCVGHVGNLGGEKGVQEIALNYYVCNNDLI